MSKVTNHLEPKERQRSEEKSGRPEFYLRAIRIGQLRLSSLGFHQRHRVATSEQDASP